MIHWLHSNDSRVVFVTLSSRTYPPMFTDSDLGPTTDCFLKYSFLNSCNLIRFTPLPESEVSSFLPAHQRTRAAALCQLSGLECFRNCAAARVAGRVQSYKSESPRIDPRSADGNVAHRHNIPRTKRRTATT